MRARVYACVHVCARAYQEGEKIRTHVSHPALLRGRVLRVGVDESWHLPLLSRSSKDTHVGMASQRAA